MSVGRDYKSKGRQPDRRGVRRLGLVVVVLSLVGLGAGGWHHWQQRDGEAATAAATFPAPAPTPVPARDQAIPEPPSQASQAPPPPERVDPPKYSFYEKLRQREVVIPESGTPNPPPRTTPPPPDPATSANSVRYLIQAGAFRTPEEADQRKAVLALLGIRSRIESDGSGLHRVRIGPLEDLDRTQTLRRQLQANDIDSYAFKID